MSAKRNKMTKEDESAFAAAGFMPSNLQARVGFKCRRDPIRNI
jgi:hypothetical protein